ncbi:hypothetical protein GGQ61_003775 [Phenylobacterium haematophilum]|uniref:CopL family metal-binding regulatory protein n=1 Tax=Phenylobacterium haematophilum TaxID=98513 RepID=A0A840A753_9CAUL|nr:hypothetical protein [Phenylobacterium haematophilum]MBB3893037.1 hypothetical protein [Phenylobacterium haematophilum]
MRRLLVLFALLGLLYSPAAALAAQRSCVEAGAEMAGMMMAATPADQAGPTAPDPCCDHGKKTMDSEACAQACATMCGISAALPTANVYVAPRPKASVVAERVLPLKPRSPPRTERPPRSIA